ncbi:MAG: hypothetical protein M1830_005189, partial [Pleopsidium flavum]
IRLSSPESYNASVLSMQAQAPSLSTDYTSSNAPSSYLASAKSSRSIFDESRGDDFTQPASEQCDVFDYYVRDWNLGRGTLATIAGPARTDDAAPQEPPELRRRLSRVNPTRQRFWVTVDISPDRKFLAGCKACSEGKRYTYYDAAAHLRRAHFIPRARWRYAKTLDEKGARGGGDYPSMEILKMWMKEVDEVTYDSPLKASYGASELLAPEASEPAGEVLGLADELSLSQKGNEALAENLLYSPDDDHQCTEHSLYREQVVPPTKDQSSGQLAPIGSTSQSSATHLNNLVIDCSRWSPPLEGNQGFRYCCRVQGCGDSLHFSLSKLLTHEYQVHGLRGQTERSQPSIGGYVRSIMRNSTSSQDRFNVHVRRAQTPDESDLSSTHRAEKPLDALNYTSDLVMNVDKQEETSTHQ